MCVGGLGRTRRTTVEALVSWNYCYPDKKWLWLGLKWNYKKVKSIVQILIYFEDRANRVDRALSDKGIKENLKFWHKQIGKMQLSIDDLGKTVRRSSFDVRKEFGLDMLNIGCNRHPLNLELKRGVWAEIKVCGVFMLTWDLKPRYWGYPLKQEWMQIWKEVARMDPCIDSRRNTIQNYEYKIR